MYSHTLLKVYVTLPAVLHVVEQSPGLYAVYKDTPDDIHVSVSEHTDFRMIYCDSCRDNHGFFWRNVCYDELTNRFTAPSYEQLIEAFDHVHFDACEAT